MAWKKKIPKKFSNQKRKHYSLLRKLRKEGKATPEFEAMLGNLSLEEVIAAKLELASKTAGGLLYGVPLWYSLPLIIKDAVLKYSISACKTSLEASRFLGIDQVYFSNLIKKYNVDGYFEEKSE